jgi:hypothetical protein
VAGLLNASFVLGTCILSTPQALIALFLAIFGDFWRFLATAEKYREARCRAYLYLFDQILSCLSFLLPAFLFLSRNVYQLVAYHFAPATTSTVFNIPAKPLNLL